MRVRRSEADRALPNPALSLRPPTARAADGASAPAVTGTIVWTDWTIQWGRLITIAAASALLACGHQQTSNSSPPHERKGEGASIPPTPGKSDGTAMKTPKEECEELMGSVVPFAEQMLFQHREFYPFGGAMAPDGTIIAVGGDTGNEHPASQDVITILEKGFQEGARTGKYKATALVIDMLVIPPGKDVKQDAIAVRLDHRNGYSVIVVFPYTIGQAGNVATEAPYAVKGEQKIFSR